VVNPDEMRQRGRGPHPEEGIMAKKTEKVKMPCRVCHGSGQQSYVVTKPDGTKETRWRTCRGCDGTGK